jgi:CRISPR-associated endoribonuclease Cas6
VGSATELRLLLKLTPKKSHPYVNDYHYHLQAAIYSMIREGGLADLHDKKGYKFFCFSNIFPFGDFREGAEKNLLVSSPDCKIIESIEHAAKASMNSGRSLTMGETGFTISGVSKPFRINMEASEITVRSATPIIMRIPRSRFQEYGIEPQIDYEYVFWRESIPLDAFVKQLRDGMVKKWREYFGSNIGDSSKYLEEELLPEITYYRFIKSVSKPLTIRQEKQIIIGSLWEITFVTVNDAQRKLLQFAMDCGLGERNSLGFGFVNLQLSFRETISQAGEGE